MSSTKMHIYFFENDQVFFAKVLFLETIKEVCYFFRKLCDFCENVVYFKEAVSRDLLQFFS